jgi:hypothetical protein
MLPAQRLLSMQTQNMTYCIRTADTPSIGAVVPPDCFGEKAHGSSLYPTEGYCFKSVFIMYLEYAKVPHVYMIFTSKFTSKNISRIA